MRKLKKFVLNDNRVLSNEELASIEGSFNFVGPDSCTGDTKGQLCIYSLSYDQGGHTTITFGTCDVEYVQENNAIVTTGFCK